MDGEYSIEVLGKKSGVLVVLLYGVRGKGTTAWGGVQDGWRTRGGVWCVSELVGYGDVWMETTFGVARSV